MKYDVKNKETSAKQKNLWAAHENNIKLLFDALYSQHNYCRDAWEKTTGIITEACNNRPLLLRKKDSNKSSQWVLSNEICGMSLYVDRFCGNLQNLKRKLSYFEDLGTNFLHLMPLFDSPEGECDGGYAVSDFRKVNPKFGSLDELKGVIQAMGKKQMYLMLDVVLNHASHKHEWAEKAKAGNKKYQEYFYMFDRKEDTLMYEQAMPEVFPESAPGNFTYVPECDKWVMTVFHNYQWDLNFSNPFLFAEMLDTIFFYANLGVDILRIDAPAFIWKQPGTNCQNLPQAHTVLRLIKQCVKAATPGMALLAEAIVAPKEIIKYFGEGDYVANECDAAYNATHMALQWDALATDDVRIMLESQQVMLKKPAGTTWINYTRCHDDIGLAFEDSAIEKAGFNPFLHRKFLQEYYSGKFEGSMATGALFSSNAKTGDARISGTLASLCGLEKAIELKDEAGISRAIDKIILMQAHCIFSSGIPMLFYGDERGTINDHSYEKDEAKNYDNRWMHRPVINWQAIDKGDEHPASKIIYEKTRHLLQLRKNNRELADIKPSQWVNMQNKHLAAYLHNGESSKLIGIFNFSSNETVFSWFTLKNCGFVFKQQLTEIITGEKITVGKDEEKITLKPYGFILLK